MGHASCCGGDSGVIKAHAWAQVPPGTVVQCRPSRAKLPLASAKPVPTPGISPSCYGSSLRLGSSKPILFPCSEHLWPSSLGLTYSRLADHGQVIPTLGIVKTISLSSALQRAIHQYIQVLWPEQGPPLGSWLPLSPCCLHP